MVVKQVVEFSEADLRTILAKHVGMNPASPLVHVAIHRMEGDRPGESSTYKVVVTGPMEFASLSD